VAIHLKRYGQRWSRLSLNCHWSLALGTDAAKPPLIAHIIHRLDVGGMENGVVNLINHLPPEAYRHAIICMTDYTDFSHRIQRQQVSLYALHKREGKDIAVHGRLWRLLRQLKPDIVHTRNMATLEAQATAALAGVRRRVHGEHGWDVGDLDGSRLKNQRLRRLFRPLVHQYIALSRQQLDYLRSTIGVAPQRLNPICNGVDVHRFRPRTADTATPLPEGFAPPETVVIGTVMRMQPVKAPLDLAQAFIALRQQAQFPQLRLVMIGDGPLRSTVQQALNQAGVANQAWLPGARDDIPELLRALDLFVLPSLAEGICNTLLEAMATGLPVIATQVGGNPDLIVAGETGTLVPPGQPLHLAQAIAAAIDDPQGRQVYGQAARQRAETEFSIATMVQRYDRLYRALLAGRQGGRDAA
jgi:sugar transferase (PEP-CTERM/EpsH1 system associated)